MSPQNSAPNCDGLVVRLGRARGGEVKFPSAINVREIERAAVVGGEICTLSARTGGTTFGLAGDQRAIVGRCRRDHTVALITCKHQILCGAK
jgi:hypothetical protein